MSWLMAKEAPACCIPTRVTKSWALVLKFTIEKAAVFWSPFIKNVWKLSWEYLKIPFVSQPELQLTYRERILQQTYKPDFVCYDKVLVEIKAVDQLIDKHEAQIINYLNATGYELGILINFGTDPKLEYKRLALTQSGTAVCGPTES